MILKTIQSTGGKSRFYRVDKIQDDVYRDRPVVAEFGKGEDYLKSLFLSVCAQAQINVYDGDNDRWLVNAVAR